MLIIFDDFIQESDAPSNLKSPALADTSFFQTLTINLDEERTFDAIGIGNTNASSININGQTVNLSTTDTNGLYRLPITITAQTVVVTFIDTTRVGRLAIGKYRKIGAAPAREPGFWTNIQSNVTLSGQVVPGVGGISGRMINVDFRYKIDREIYDDIQNAYPKQIARMYPFFMSFEDQFNNRFPMDRFYGYTDPRMLFQSSVNFFRYSKKFKFTEAF